MTDESLIIRDGIYYEAVLKELKKSKQHFQPIYEVFTNALESIKLRRFKVDNGFINISILSRSSLDADECFLQDIIIEDSGIGFDDINFERMTRFKDNRKGFFNNGSGRVQILHFFDTAQYFSTFCEDDNFFQRSFKLSKHYLFKNAIISDHKVENSTRKSTGNKVILHGILDKNDEHAYNNLTAEGLKKALIARYMVHFCTNRENLPKINLVRELDGERVEDVSICESDIPLNDNEEDVEIAYQRLTVDGKDFEESDRYERLRLTVFKIDEKDLKKNELKLTSKGEIIPDSKIELNDLSAHDRFDGSRYLFLISGTYIDERDGDTRGAISIQRKEDFKKANASQMNLYREENIFLDDIEDKANSTILRMYPQIRKKKEEKQQDIEKLKNMFLLSQSTLNSLSFTLDDTEEKILEKVYTADSKTLARRDAEIKRNIESLETLDTTKYEYHQCLTEITSNLVKAIPLQNRVALTHYVARRKLVLELFGKILDRQLNIQKSGDRNVDEKLLHNLIFQQTATNPEKSDLWLINEDFIYFSGASDKRLCDTEVCGKKMFKAQFTAEEDRYLLSLGENRKSKKPDVLLFPEEGKCIIIEFKNTNVNVAEHLHQIKQYAFLIRNFTEDDLQIDTFYGYLIGEGIEPLDVRSCDSDFIHSYHFDYLFRPDAKVVGINGRRDGSMYAEVIKYTTLLKRAIKRNEIFIQKLTGPVPICTPSVNRDMAEPGQKLMLKRGRK